MKIDLSIIDMLALQIDIMLDNQRLTRDQYKIVSLLLWKSRVAIESDQSESAYLWAWMAFRYMCGYR